MSRKLPGKRIEWVEVKGAPSKGDFRLDGTTFVGIYGSRTFEGSNGDAVKKELVAYIKASIDLKWIPVIEIHDDGGAEWINNLSNGYAIRFYYDRYYIAHDGNKWLKCGWAVYPPGTVQCSGPAPAEDEYALAEQGRMTPEELDAARIWSAHPHFSFTSMPVNVDLPYTDPERNHRGTSSHLVAYSDTTWNSLLGLNKKLNELHLNIQKMFRTKKGLAALTQFSLPMLEDFK